MPLGARNGLHRAPVPPPHGLARASPGTRARRSTPCPRRRPRCRAARSPGWPTRSTRWCCRSRAPAGCASPSPTAQRPVRVAYAGTNDQPYGSVGRWLLDQGWHPRRHLAGHPEPGWRQPPARQRAAVEQPALRLFQGRTLVGHGHGLWPCGPDWPPAWWWCPRV